MTINQLQSSDVTAQPLLPDHSPAEMSRTVVCSEPEQLPSDTEKKLEPPAIKAQHAELYKKVQDSRDELQRDTSKRDQLMSEIDEFIANMRYISLQMVKSKNYTDYDWLERVATDWQEVFSGILVIPRNIRKEIELPPRPSKVLRSGERVEIPYSNIRSNITMLAYRIGEDRKLAELEWQITNLNQKAKKLSARIQELSSNRNRIHQEIPSSPEDEKKDWHAATVYFGAGVLAGRPNLAYQLGADSYRQLEQVFLNEVKRFNAYHVWQAKGDGWRPSEIEGNYLDACEKLRQMMFEPNIKAPAADFANVRAYLIRNYHIDNKDFPSSKAAEKLKRRKAQRIWESKSWSEQSQKQEEENWELAEEYVELFYVNVIPAIEGQSESIKKVSMEKVLQAFREPWWEYGVINCLEAAIAIYFFDPDLVRECCNNEIDII